jgi:hypothetical protein
MRKSINLYINHIDSKKTHRIIISNDRTIAYLKQRIIKKLKLKEEDIKLRYSTILYKNTKQIKDTAIPNNATIFISTSKLRGGDIGLAYGLVTVPNTALIINLLFMILVCPIQYCLLMYGSSSKIKILKMKFSTSFFANFNNFKLREVFDDTAKKELEKDNFPNFKYSVIRSKLFMIYSVLYFSFVSFFANLFPLSSFIDHYGKVGTGAQTSKCFIHTNTSAITHLGFIILIGMPCIIIFLNYFGFQFGLILYLTTLAVGCACLLTSVYYKQTQNLKQALQYRDPMVPEFTYTNDVNYMPSYFWALYISPAICVGVILLLYLLGVKHSVIWGLICSFSCIVPLIYLMGNQMSLYCIQFPFCTRTPDNLQDTIDKNDYNVTTATQEKEQLSHDSINMKA